MTVTKKIKNRYNLRFGEQLNLRHEYPVIRLLDDRFEHTYIIGKTGMGKSSLIERMAIHDIESGIATIYIDPKGETVKRLYQLTKDKSKIRYISIESPVVINPLNKEGYRLDSLIQEFIAILDVLITLTASNPESTVLMREIINMAMRSIVVEDNKNLEYLTKLLLYENTRTELRNSLPVNSDERKYWEEFDGKGARTHKNYQKVECAQRLASRLMEISTGEMKDFVVGSNELDITKIVQNKEIVLVDTSRMNRNSRIYLSNLIVYSVLSYCEFAKIKDKPLLVYVDEFQIVVSELFSDLLARSRGSKIGFTLAHQNFQQIPRNTLGSIFGNVGTQICFRCGDEEARRFSTLFDVKPSEIFNLPKYQAWVRIGTNNTLIETFPPQKIDTANFQNPSIKPIQTEIQYPEQTINFLSDEWVNY